MKAKKTEISMTPTEKSMVACPPDPPGMTTPSGVIAVKALAVRNSLTGLLCCPASISSSPRGMEMAGLFSVEKSKMKQSAKVRCGNGRDLLKWVWQWVGRTKMGSDLLFQQNTRTSNKGHDLSI